MAETPKTQVVGSGKVAFINEGGCPGTKAPGLPRSLSVWEKVEDKTKCPRGPSGAGQAKEHAGQPSHLGMRLPPDRPVTRAQGAVAAT